MRTKKDIIFSISAIVLGIIPFVILAVIALVSLAPNASGSVGIIGGAGAPTLRFVLENFISSHPLYFIVLCFGPALSLCAAFYLIFTKTVKQNCTVKTSGISLAISTATGALVYCVFVLREYIFNARVSDFAPYFSTALVCLIFAAALVGVLIWLVKKYISFRKSTPSVKGVIIDIALAIVFVFSLGYLFAATLGLVLGWFYDIFMPNRMK